MYSIYRALFIDPECWTLYPLLIHTTITLNYPFDLSESVGSADR